MEIHQLLSHFSPRDAVSNQARALQRVLRSWGHASEIYARYLVEVPEVGGPCRPWSDFRPAQADAVLFHYSTASDDIIRLFRGCRGKRLLVYHNVTPAHYYAPYNREAYAACRRGRARLGDLAGDVDLALGASPFNCREL